jgi:hypothetical protein
VSGSVPFTGLSGRVAIAGDWHGNVPWVQSVIPRLHRQAPDVTTIFHLGDFGLFPERIGEGFLSAVDFLSVAAGIERIWVTPGNHEDWGQLAARFDARPGQPVQLSRVVWTLPRSYRFTIARKRWMSFGGAASLDLDWDGEGQEWQSGEAPTDSDVRTAIAGGLVDVLLTHETVNGGTREVEDILAANPLGWGQAALEYSAASRRRVTQVWEAVHPAILAHGHIHMKGEIELADRRRVYSLGSNGRAGNLGVLNVETLEWRWLTDEP